MPLPDPASGKGIARHDRTALRDTGLAGRLGWGLTVSVFLNVLLWSVVAHAFRRPAAAPPDPVAITRLILPATLPPAAPPRRARSFPRIRPSKPAPLASTKAKRPSPPPPPEPIRRQRTIPAPPHPLASPGPPAKPAHNRVLTAAGPTPAVNIIRPGGDALPGTSLSAQSSGTGTQDTMPSPPSPPPPSPAPSNPKPSAPDPKPSVPPVAQPAAPPPPAVPIPHGPTTQAQVARQVLPQIPDDLQEEDYQSSVHVTMEIDATGAVTRVALNSSSGNGELDRRVTEALKAWRWHPALQDGHPVASVRRFRFDFEVR